MEIKVETKEYERHGFTVSRKYYSSLPDSLQPVLGSIVQWLGDTDGSEYKVVLIKDNEVECIDLHTNGQRTFFKDSIRISEKQIKRDKASTLLAKRNEKWKKREEKEKIRAERLFKKLVREEAKKNRTLSRKKVKEVTIKFI